VPTTSSLPSWTDPSTEQLRHLEADDRDAQDFSDYFTLWERQSAYINVNRRIKDHLVLDWQIPRLPGSSQGRPRRYTDSIPWSQDARDLLFSKGDGEGIGGKLVFEHVVPLKNVVTELRDAYRQGNGRDGASMLLLLRRVHLGPQFTIVTAAEDRKHIGRSVASRADALRKYESLAGGLSGFVRLIDDPRFSAHFLTP
jgi:hypothetical protein